MFNNLSERLTASIGKLRGIGRLTEDNIKDTLNEVRRALLEADVALPVAKQFVDTVREQAIGQGVIKNVRPGEAFIKLVQDELTRVLGSETSELNLRAEPPVVILMAGLQGSGKTTTTAKLANWLQKFKKKKVMVTSADVYRPAAIEQLKTLADQIGAEYFPSTVNDKPIEIAKEALKHAKKILCGCFNYRYRRSFTYR